jgi:hypothetical protein
MDNSPDDVEAFAFPRSLYNEERTILEEFMAVSWRHKKLSRHRTDPWLKDLSSENVNELNCSLYQQYNSVRVSEEGRLFFPIFSEVTCNTEPPNVFFLTEIKRAVL